MGKHQKSNDGMEFGVFAIDPHSLKIIRASMPKITKQGKFSGEFGRLRDHRSALHGMEKLGSMKAQAADITVFKNWYAIYFDPEGMRNIVDDFESVFVRNRLYCLHFARNAIDMGGENGAMNWGIV